MEKSGSITTIGPWYNIVVPDIPFKWNYGTIGMELWIGYRPLAWTLSNGN